LSGQRWMLIALRGLPASERKRPLTHAMRLEFRGSLSAQWRGSENKLKVLETLGLDTEADLPCLQILCVDAGAQAFVQHVPIRGGSPAEVFESLKATVVAVTEAIDGLDEQHLKDAQRARCDRAAAAERPAPATGQDCDAYAAGRI
jgi:hypothetical protein